MGAGAFKPKLHRPGAYSQSLWKSLEIIFYTVNISKAYRFIFYTERDNGNFLEPIENWKTK